MKLFTFWGVFFGLILSSSMALKIWAQDKNPFSGLAQKNKDVHDKVLQMLGPSAAINFSQVNKEYNQISPGRAGAILSLKLAVQPSLEDKLKEAQRMAGVGGELYHLKNHVTHISDFQIGTNPNYVPEYGVFMSKLKKIFPHLKFIHHIFYKNLEVLLEEGYFKVDPLTLENYNSRPIFSWYSTDEYPDCNPYNDFTNNFKTFLAIKDNIKHLKSGNDQDEEAKKSIPYYILYQSITSLHPPEKLEQSMNAVLNTDDDDLGEEQKTYKHFAIPLLTAIKERKSIEELRTLLAELMKRGNFIR